MIVHMQFRLDSPQLKPPVLRNAGKGGITFLRCARCRPIDARQASVSPHAEPMSAETKSAGSHTPYMYNPRNQRFPESEAYFMISKRSLSSGSLRTAVSPCANAKAPPQQQ